MNFPTQKKTWPEVKRELDTMVEKAKRSRPKTHIDALRSALSILKVETHTYDCAAEIEAVQRAIDEAGASPEPKPKIISLYNFGEMDGEWICHGVSFGGSGDRSRFVADIERRWK